MFPAKAAKRKERICRDRVTTTWPPQWPILREGKSTISGQKETGVITRKDESVTLKI